MGTEVTEPRLPIAAPMVIDSLDGSQAASSRCLRGCHPVRHRPRKVPGRLTLDDPLCTVAGRAAHGSRAVARRAASRASDIYAAGLGALWLLCGRPATRICITELPRCGGERPATDLGAIARSAAGLKALLDRCVTRDRQLRPHHVDIVRDELEALAAIYVPLGQSSSPG